jgi:DNA-binding transcriptional regulator GbsR (MarR family)
MIDSARADFMERYARVIERGGQSRIAGRIYAYLLTSDQPYHSLKQLADELEVSKASVSTNTRTLIGMKMLQNVAVPGSREEHYALATDGMEATLFQAVRQARAIAALADEGLALAPKDLTPGRIALTTTVHRYTQLAAAIEALLAKPMKKAR